MNIAIKSEADSRMLIYPLIKCLYPFGSIALVTNNVQCNRLIEEDYTGGFKNVRVMICEDNDLQGTIEADGMFTGKYDFIIFDNVGAVDYDLMIAIVTNHISSSYIEDLLYIIDEPKTHIIKYGTPASGSKETKPKRKRKEVDADVSAEEPLPNRFNETLTENELLQQKLASKESKWCKFPTFEQIEIMESRHQMLVPDDTILTEVYRLLGDYLSIDKRMFMKGARIKDESSSIITGTDVR